MHNLLIPFLAVFLVVAAIYDVRVKRIPNLLTYTAMAVAIIYHSATRGLDGLLFSAGGVALGIAMFILPYLMGGMGAGDAKLMGAVGAVLGPKGVFISSLFTAVIGGIYALIIMVIKPQESRGFISRSTTTIKTLVLTGHLIPIPASETETRLTLCYGVAIAIGTFIYLFSDILGYTFPF